MCIFGDLARASARAVFSREGADATGTSAERCRMPRLRQSALVAHATYHLGRRSRRTPGPYPFIRPARLLTASTSLKKKSDDAREVPAVLLGVEVRRQR